MADLKEIGKQAKAARYILAGLDTDTKNKALFTAAECLEADAADILAENAKDLEAGRSRSMPKGLLDRLSLTQKRISDMAEGLRQVAALPDPVGEILDTFTRPNGLVISKRRVPLGVIGIIYESRPNVTADAFGLCFKAGNAASFSEENTTSAVFVIQAVRRLSATSPTNAPASFSTTPHAAIFKSGTTSRTASKIPTNMPRLFLTRTAEPKSTCAVPSARSPRPGIAAIAFCAAVRFQASSAGATIDCSTPRPVTVPRQNFKIQDKDFSTSSIIALSRPSSQTPDSTTSSIQNGSNSRQNPERNRSIRKMNPSVSS